MTTHVVFLEKDTPNLIPLIGRDGARLLGVPVADFTRMLRHARGSLGPFEPDLARRLSALLESKGLRARSVAESTLPPSLPVRALLDADPTPPGFLLQRIEGGAPDLVPWELVEILAVGLVTFVLPAPGRVGEVDTSDTMARALGAIFGPDLLPPPDPLTARLRSKKELAHCLDVVVLEPAARYRIVSNRFVYDYLDERMQMTSVLNFRTLVTDLAVHAPEALLARSTLAYLEEADAREYRFSTPQSFDAYMDWLRGWHLVW